MSSPHPTFDLSIVIPCYNEADNLSHLFKRLDKVVDCPEHVEIILVDNGSTDDTAAVLDSLLSAEDAPIRVVSVPTNIGYGHGIMQGVLSANSEVISWCHADMQTDPMDAVGAYRVYIASTNERKIVKGKRVGRGLLDAFFTAGMSLFASLALGVRLNDINAQPKVFDRSFVEVLADGPSDFSLDLFLLLQARRRGCEVLTFPVHFGERQHGVAKGGGSLKGKFKLIARTVKYIMKTRSNEKGHV